MVHKAILASQSNFFLAACTKEGFAVSLTVFSPSTGFAAKFPVICVDHITSDGAVDHHSYVLRGHLSLVVTLSKIMFTRATPDHVQLTCYVVRQEQRDGKICLEEPRQAVRCMLEFLYGVTYKTPPDMSISDEFALHAKIHCLGHKYDIPTLCDAARWKVASLVFKDASNARKITSDEATILACLKIAPIVYTKTPETERGLRDILLQVVREGVSGTTDSNETEAIFDECPEFAIDIAKAVARKERTFSKDVREVPRVCYECGQRIHEWKVAVCCESCGARLPSSVVIHDI